MSAKPYLESMKLPYFIICLAPVMKYIWFVIVGDKAANTELFSVL